MKFLHTADWHIGRMLYGKKRYQEFSAFLNWLVTQLEEHQIDTLLIPGDIFDTRSPSNRAQELYYNFLVQASNTCCQHIVITSGNHDSPSFLDAPKALLHALQVHVVGQVKELDDEIIELKNAEGEAQAIIAAVPYLRDRDLRKAEAGESIDDKERKIIEGIKSHYQILAEKIEDKNKSNQNATPQTTPTTPVIAMGHLFALGGQTGDGVRDLYVGNLGSIGADAFPDTFDYVALGHLHVPQKVGKKDHIRYSGSPIPMGYGEAGQQKEVLIITFDQTTPTIKAQPVPCFQELLRISGTLDELLEQINKLVTQQCSAWLEIDYTGTDTINDLRTRLNQAVEDSPLEIRRIKNSSILRTLQQTTGAPEEALEDLTEMAVFQRCLDQHAVPESDRAEILRSYQEILTDYHEADTNAE